jgi:hypothetical protein
MPDHDEDDEPELAGYEPHDRPLRSPHLVTAMRVVVVLGLIGLLLPGILVTISTANNTAQRTCAVYAAYYAPEAVRSGARFELVSAAGAGWNCYAVEYEGTEVLVQALGLIPGGPRLPSAPLVESSVLIRAGALLNQPGRRAASP